MIFSKKPNAPSEQKENPTGMGVKPPVSAGKMEEKPSGGSMAIGDKTPMGMGGGVVKKAQASVLAPDLEITGNIHTAGDVQVLGKVNGDIHAHLLTIGEGSIVKGEVVADDLVINGRIIGRVRGLKVRLTATAQVKGDIIHKTIAIESGAHFEGSVTRQDDPLSTGGSSGAGAGAGASNGNGGTSNGGAKSTQAGGGAGAGDGDGKTAR